jgi:hypothetical protein
MRSANVSTAIRRERFLGVSVVTSLLFHFFGTTLLGDLSNQLWLLFIFS